MLDHFSDLPQGDIHGHCLDITLSGLQDFMSQDKNVQKKNTMKQNTSQNVKLSTLKSNDNNFISHQHNNKYGRTTSQSHPYP